MKYLLVLLLCVTGCSASCEASSYKCEPYTPGDGWHCHPPYAMNQYGVCICPDEPNGGVVK